MRIRNALVVILVLAIAPILQAGLDDDTFKELTRDARKSMKKDPFAAVYAVKKLGEDDSERAAKFIFDLATSIKTPPKVYRQCIQTLSGFKSGEAADYIAKKSSKGKTAEKLVGAEVLSKMSGENALKTLVELAGDKSETIARTAARSLGERGDPAGADALVGLLEKTEKKHGLAWQASLDALRKLAGSDESGPWIAADWRDYWAARKRNENWKKTNQDSSKGGPHTELPEFFGAKVVSRNVIFIMDLSSSMLESDSGGQRLARMKQELVKTIEKMDGESIFNVLGFNSSLFPWKRRLAPATDANRKSAADFVTKMKAIAYTNTDDALKVAFSDKNIDTIILLSDGVPLRREHKDQMSDAFIVGILDWVSTVNRFRRVVIHTFGFDSIAQDPGGERCVAFLKDLAEQNEGKYHNIR